MSRSVLVPIDGIVLQQDFVHTNGVNLHIVQSGPADGRLLILLHGFPEFWYGWRGQIGYFASRGWRVVAPDQRGYNLSEKPPGVVSYAIESLAADIDGLIRALGHERAWLVGHDWGAAVAWETAMRYPQRVEKLGILNVPHPDVMSKFITGSLRQILKSWYIFYFQIPGLADWMLSRKGYANLRQMLMASGKAGTFTATDLEQYRDAWSQPGALTAMLNWYRAAFRGGVKTAAGSRGRAMRRVHPPTLMLWGKNDIALGAAMAQPSIDLCDDGRLVFFENATHWVQHDETDAVNQELERFLLL